jgi:hypothetical protein
MEFEAWETGTHEVARSKRDLSYWITLPHSTGAEGLTSVQGGRLAEPDVTSVDSGQRSPESAGSDQDIREACGSPQAPLQVLLPAWARCLPRSLRFEFCRPGCSKRAGSNCHLPLGPTDHDRQRSRGELVIAMRTVLSPERPTLRSSLLERRAANHID